MPRARYVLIHFLHGPSYPRRRRRRLHNRQRLERTTGALHSLIPYGLFTSRFYRKKPHADVQRGIFLFGILSTFLTR